MGEISDVLLGYYLLTDTLLLSVNYTITYKRVRNNLKKITELDLFYAVIAELVTWGRKLGRVHNLWIGAPDVMVLAWLLL